MEVIRSRLSQGFWLKNFSLHERVRLQLKECLDSGFVPSSLTRGRTLLLQKDQSKGIGASNYRPRTCLAFIMWKLLTGVIADHICTFRSREVVARRAERVQERF